MAKTEEEILKTVVSSALWLITRLLGNQVSEIPETGVDNINPLGQIALAVETLKAQTTKLALLAQNEPYTPGEITKIVRSLSELTLPSLVGSMQQTSAADFSNAVCNFVRLKADSILREMTFFLEGIPTSRAAAEAARLTTPEALKSTGVIWELCDALNAGLFEGVAGIIAKRAQEHLEIIEDALKELREFKENGPDFDDEDEDEEDDEDNSGEDEQVRDISDSLGQMNMKIAFTPAEEQMLTNCIDLMHHVSLIFPPIIKRRIKRFRQLNASSDLSEKLTDVESSTLDTFLPAISFTEDKFDDAAMYLYDGKFDFALSTIRDTGDRLQGCGQAFRLNWSQTPDELTDWFDKWNAKWQRIRPNLVGTLS